MSSLSMDSHSLDHPLKIGDVAHASGLSVKTIRYYEDIGLLTPTVERSDTGYRLFNRQVLNRLAFIKQAQSLGLALTEISDVLHVHDQGHLPCGEVRQHLQEKVTALSQQIEALESLRTKLQKLLLDWQEHPSSDLAARVICPNIQIE